MECVQFNMDSYPNVAISCRLWSVSSSGSCSPRKVCILLDIKNITCLSFWLCVKNEYTSVLVRAEVFLPGRSDSSRCTLFYLCGSSYKCDINVFHKLIKFIYVVRPTEQLLLDAVF